MKLSEAKIGTPVFVHNAIDTASTGTHLRHGVIAGQPYKINRCQYAVPVQMSTAKIQEIPLSRLQRYEPKNPPPSI